MNIWFQFGLRQKVRFPTSGSGMSFLRHNANISTVLQDGGVDFVNTGTVLLPERRIQLMVRQVSLLDYVFEKLPIVD